MKNKIISLFVFVLLLSACQPVKVAVDYDKSVSFNNYKTYWKQKDYKKAIVTLAEGNTIDSSLEIK